MIFEYHFGSKIKKMLIIKMFFFKFSKGCYGLVKRM